MFLEFLSQRGLGSIQQFLQRTVLKPSKQRSSQSAGAAERVTSQPAGAAEQVTSQHGEQVTSLPAASAAAGGGDVSSKQNGGQDMMTA